MFDSYADILCPDLSPRVGCAAPKEPGALVTVGGNACPVFEIVAIEGQTAWVREPVTFRSEALVPVERLRVAAVPR